MQLEAMAGKSRTKKVEIKEKSLETWIWDAACLIRGAKDAPKYKDYILPLIFTKRLCDVFDDEVDQDVVESVLYLPENLFYNTTAPGIVLFLNRNKPKKRQGNVFLVNASQIYEKGDPKNFIPDDGIQCIADSLIGWKEQEKLSRIVDHAELKKNDYNISPSRYIHTSDAETYRPIAEIVAELDEIEAQAKETDQALRDILKKIGV